MNQDFDLTKTARIDTPAIDTAPGDKAAATRISLSGVDTTERVAEFMLEGFKDVLDIMIAAQPCTLTRTLEIKDIDVSTTNRRQSATFYIETGHAFYEIDVDFRVTRTGKRGRK